MNKSNNTLKVKLNEKYANDFLTTTKGYSFYHKHNKLGKEYNVVEVDITNNEIAQLMNQNILIVADDEDEGEEKVDVIKENAPKNTIDNSVKTEDVRDKEQVKETVEEEPVQQDKNDDEQAEELIETVEASNKNEENIEY